MRNLNIIGNGFDLHHNIPTKYADYREWLYINGSCRTILNCHSQNDDPFWSDVENGLKIDCNKFVKYYIEAFNFVDVSPGHLIDQNQEVVDKVNALRNTYDEYTFLTGVEFYNWLYETYYSAISDTKKDDLFYSGDKNFFVNFNYTLTLEDLYNVDKESILHIHGVLNKEIKDQLISCVVVRDSIMKHRKDALVRSEIQFGCIENNPKVVDDIGILKQLKARNEYFNINTLKNDLKMYLRNSYKNPKRNYSRLEKFIDSCGEIDQIIIMGNNVFGPDWGYYENILIPRYKMLRWIVYCYGDNYDSAYKLRDKYSLNVEIRQW